MRDCPDYFKEYIDPKDCLHASYHYEPIYDKFGDIIDQEKYCNDCEKRLD